jgi:aryl-alcohol dehydrogenase/geraniol dehydrogenase (NAD+)
MAHSGSTDARAAVLRNVGAPFAVEKIEVGEPRADEVLVEMAGVGICHTDIACRDGFPVPLPIVLGHEGSGIVKAVGADVKSVKPGDRVVLAFNSCGQCTTCRQDKPSACCNFLAFNFGGVRISDGSTALKQASQAIHGSFFGQSSFATHAISREVNTVVVDSALPLELLGPLGCGIMTGAGAAINSLKLQPGQSLAIFGGGTVGLSALLGALAVGAGKVYLVEPSAKRRALAQEMKAANTFDPKNGSDVVTAIKEANGGPVDLAIDTTAIPAVIRQAIDCVIPGGAVGLVGIPAPDAQIPVTLLDLLVKNVSLKPVVEGDANPKTFVPKLLALHAAGKFPFERLITKYKFDQINEAIKATESGEVVKPVLTF